MITQTNVPGPESNSSDIIKDMSPQTNIHAPSFEDDEFDIPQVNNFQINVIIFWMDRNLWKNAKNIFFFLMTLYEQVKTKV